MSSGIRRRAEVSANVNDRYADALGSLDTTVQIGELVAPICRPARRHGIRYRALRPWSDDDRTLLSAISQGQYVTDGFTLAGLRPEDRPIGRRFDFTVNEQVP